MKIAIGNDHAGPDYKFAIVKLLESKAIQVQNFGTDSLENPSDNGYNFAGKQGRETNVVQKPIFEVLLVIPMKRRVFLMKLVIFRIEEWLHLA